MANSGLDVAAAVSWRAVCDQAAGPMAMLDLDGRYVYVNPALCELLGYEEADLLDRKVQEFTHPDDPIVSDDIQDVVMGRRERIRTEKRYVRADGSVIWALLCAAVIRDAEGSSLFFLSQIYDITSRREAELLWQRTFANAPIGMGLLDLDGYWTEVNDTWCDLLGYSRAEMLSMRYSDVTYPDDGQRGEAALADLVEGRRASVSLEKRYRHKEGHPLWVLLRTSVVPGADGKPAYLVSQCEGIGQGRLADAHVAHLALHDPLTGLANRALLADRLDRALGELPGHGGVVAVLLADLDKLKPVNDQFGHAVGDELLVAAADELLRATTAADTVARLGGDEFVVVASVADQCAAETLRDRTTDHLNTEVEAFGSRFKLQASVGLATTNHSMTPQEELLHNADRDMYLRKTCQRG